MQKHLCFESGWVFILDIGIFFFLEVSVFCFSIQYTYAVLAVDYSCKVLCNVQKLMVLKRNALRVSIFSVIFELLSLHVYRDEIGTLV